MNTPDASGDTRFSPFYSPKYDSKQRRRYRPVGNYSSLYGPERRARCSRVRSIKTARGS